MIRRTCALARELLYGRWSGDEMNNAIDHYILHEISELRCQEKRLNVALLGAPQDSSSDPFVRALARLQARVEELDWVLDQLDVVAVTEPAAA